MSFYLHDFINHARGRCARTRNHGGADPINVHWVATEPCDRKLIQVRRNNNFSVVRAYVIELFANTPSNSAEVSRINTHSAKLNASDVDGIVDALGDVEGIY